MSDIFNIDIETLEKGGIQKAIHTQVLKCSLIQPLKGQCYKDQCLILRNLTEAYQ